MQAEKKEKEAQAQAHLAKRDIQPAPKRREKFAPI
jgi:hypothetical protein